MQSPSDHNSTAGRYVVDLTRPLAGGGGQPAFVATDLQTGRADLMAIAVSRAAPVRANVLRDLVEPVENLLVPLGCGAVPNFTVICPVPPGPAVGIPTRPWTEAALIGQLLRPVAQTLRKLEARHLTHRAIRPNNIFLQAPDQPVTLGCAWAAPPAFHQPPAYEPFYSLMCHPAGRGDGSIADDVYALGCLMIALATGAEPLAGLDTAAVLRRKLEFGSFAAIAGDARLPSLVADLARGMLAEDPDHRPTPAMLHDPATARGRRVAARPPRKAPRPLAVGSTAAWDARTLAHAIAKEPDSGIRALRDGTVAHWLRRGLGDAGLCARIEDMLRQRATEPATDESQADTMLAMRVVATLEPLAPVCWRGAIFWPDGLGPALAAGANQDPALLERLEDAIATEAIGTWAATREARCDVAVLQMEARVNQALLRVRPPAGGIARLTYTLNPLLPCGGALGDGHWVTNLEAVAPAMEAIVQGGGQPFDLEGVAFLVAHVTRELDMEVNALAAHHGAQFPAIPWLRILARLQTRYVPRPMTGLARWMVTQAEPLTAGWINRDRRASLLETLRGLAEDGYFDPIVAVLDNPLSLEADAAGAVAATTSVARIDVELRRIANGGDYRTTLAIRYGQELTAGIGLTALAGALAGALIVAAFG